MSNPKKYKHIFFDLDRTLWDFDKNSNETLNEIIIEFNLEEKIQDTSDFQQRYTKHNNKVWELYSNRKMGKTELRTERFRLLLAEYNIDDNKLAHSISDFYVENSPNKGNLIVGAKEVLEYLNSIYKLHIISNGFHETQLRKLNAAKIEHYFDKIYTSERIGAAKPNKVFFEYALKSTNARKAESLVIGDDFTNDILGASNFGIDQMWYNPQKDMVEFNPSYIILDLLEIKNIL